MQARKKGQVHGCFKSWPFTRIFSNYSVKTVCTLAWRSDFVYCWRWLYPFFFYYSLPLPFVLPLGVVRSVFLSTSRGKTISLCLTELLNKKCRLPTVDLPLLAFWIMSVIHKRLASRPLSWKFDMPDASPSPR